MRAFTGLLLILYGFSRAISALEDAPATEAPCRARVWVRAPDLEPGQVVQGHVKVKLDGSCEDVSSYSLGLRFAERSWVKTRCVFCFLFLFDGGESLIVCLQSRGCKTAGATG
jgi:hypothetical protein